MLLATKKRTKYNHKMRKFVFNLTYSGIELNKDYKMAHLICPLSVRSERKFIWEQKSQLEIR